MSMLNKTLFSLAVFIFYIKLIMKKLLPIILLLLGSSSLLLGQILKCGQEKFMEQHSPQYQQMADQAYDHAREQLKHSVSRSNQLLTVPVVVHVVYNTPEQNISDEVIFSQLEVLNEDFQRLNTDAGEAREMYQAVADNPQIQFVLADTDPDGNPTTGITRTQTELPTFLPLNITNEDAFVAADSCDVNLINQQEFLDSFHCVNNTILELAFEKLEAQDTTQLDDMKFSNKGGIDAWDQDRYINIWVCNLTFRNDGQEAVGLLGFGTPPIEAPNWEGADFPENIDEIDGVVVHYESFGRDNSILADLGASGGRTCTHEIGHYLGLRHIFGDGDCGDDDGLEDTPVTNALFPIESFEELLFVPSCEEAKETDTCPDDDLPDMIENYMDYSPQTCQNLFTVQQVAIMRAMLEGPRSGLILEQVTNTYSLELDQAVTLYPNPTNGLLQLEMNGFNKEAFTVVIENTIGQQLVNQPASNHLQIGHLAKGLYWVRLKGEQMEIVRKIVLK